MVAGQPEDVSVVLSNFQAIAAVLNGGIDNANVNAAAAIAASKLAAYPTDVSKVLRGDGTWTTVPARTSGVVISAANTDLAIPSTSAALIALEIGTGGGTLRNVATPLVGGTLLTIFNLGTAFTIKHNIAGTGSNLYLATGADLIIPTLSYITFQHNGGTTWVEVGRGPASGANILDRTYPNANFANTTAETTLYTKSIPAGIMGIDKVLRLTMKGVVQHNGPAGTDTLSWRVKFGGTTIINAQDSFGNAINGKVNPWKIVVEIANLGAANQQWVDLAGAMLKCDSGAITTGQGGGQNNGGSSILLATGNGIQAIDTTIAQTLAITGQWSVANVQLSFTTNHCLLELL